MPDRLFLRPFEPGDGEGFYRNVMTDAAAELFGLDHPAMPYDAQNYIADRIPYYDKPHFYDFAIVRTSDGEVIGEVNAAYIAPGQADIGYLIGSAFRGQGYAKEAVILLIERLKEDGISLIYGACRDDNTASHAVMRACGMKKTTEIPKRVRRREEESKLQWYMIETQH